MNIIPNETFLQHAESHGLRPDPRYSEPRTLNFQNDLSFAIPMPQDVRLRSNAIYAALALIDDPKGMFAWQRGGVWTFSTRQNKNVRETLDRAVASIFANAGVANPTTATLKIDASEKDTLYGLIYMNSVTACCVRDDIFVIPESCDFILYFDHDEQIIVNFRTIEIQNRIIEQFTAELRTLKVPTYDDPPNTQ
jgi:hypothetical protein